MSVVHYVFVRQDLPVGVIAAMITHAAGESSPLYSLYNNGKLFEHATAVVLAAKNVNHLQAIRRYLDEEHIPHIAIHECNKTYDELMAVGVIPAKKEKLHVKMRPFVLLNSCLPNPPTHQILLDNQEEDD